MWSKIKSRLLAVVAATFLFFQTDVYAQNCEAFDRPAGQFGIELESVLASTTIDRPTSMAQPPDDPSKWFVIDQEGLVSVFSHGDTFTKIGTMLDIRDRVTRTFDGRKWNEMGLLSIAVHPDFATNGYVYLYYSAVGPNATTPLYARLSRFTSFDNGLTLDPDSEEVVIQLDRDSVFHWGGQMMFNPNDGYFHMSIGDGGRRQRSQNYFNMNGSFIRIDMGSGALPYSIPADNPFADGVDALPEIFAKGLRNPWRWSIDEETNRIFLGDVGKSDWEEVNYIESGKNYGWPRRQGAHCHEPATGCQTAGLTDPIVEYPHDDTGGVAIIGGYVYRGSQMPDFYGHYIYADALGRMWSFDTTDITNPTPTVIFEDVPQKFSFAQGADKELYLLALGKIDKLVQAPGSGSGSVPELLSETGCFTSTSPLVPNANLQAYDINTPLWSDGAAKQRWMNVPDNQPITVTGTQDWDFPIGTVMVKNFSLQDQLIETRLFLRHDDGEWAGYTYEWDDTETDATLVPAQGKDRQVGAQLWHYPSRIQCVQCHTSSAGFTVGPETAQLNRYFSDPDTGELVNQLQVLAARYQIDNANFSDPTELPMLAGLDDKSQTQHWKARSYLYSNCAMCHQPGGTGRGPEDFRYSVTDAQINAIDVDPTLDDLGVSGAKLIFPGDASKSVMALRMHSLDPGIRMPQIGTILEDTQATQLVDEWIDSMDDLDPASGEACGEPSIDGAQDSGVYLWKDCAAADTWYLSAVSGGGAKQYLGSIMSDAVMSIVSLGLTGTEVDDVSLDGPSTELSFDLNQRDGLIDTFSFSVDPDVSSCLRFDYPVNTQIWLGSQAFEVKTNNLDLNTLAACDDSTLTAVGAPEIDRTTESGVFAWQEQDGEWVVRVVAGGLDEALIAGGSISSSNEFLSITEKSIEPNDVFTQNPNSIDFALKVRAPWLDGFQFTVPTGSDLCLEVDDPSIEVRIGPRKTLVSAPFSLSALGSCQTSFVDGMPEILPNDEGVFVWRDNGVWHLKTTTPSSSYFVQGRLQSYNGPLIDWSNVSLESEGDFLIEQAPNRLKFRMITSDGDQDELSFVIQETGETCFNIKIPDPTPVYLGPGRIPIPVPYDLTSLGPCSRGN